MMQRRFINTSFSSSSKKSLLLASFSSTTTTAHRAYASESTRNVYSSPTQRLKQKNRRFSGAGAGVSEPRWKQEHDGHVQYRQQPTGSNKANPNMADFANAKVKHWHMWLMVLGCAVGGYFAGQSVSIDPKKLNPKDNNTGDRKIGKLDLKSIAASSEEGGETTGKN